MTAEGISVPSRVSNRSPLPIDHRSKASSFEWRRRSPQIIKYRRLTEKSLLIRMTGDRIVPGQIASGQDFQWSP